tara:strand:- start:3222 stop:3428 length:207 start_codon:yes stop_codon:yes gene_type:complete
MNCPLIKFPNLHKCNCGRATTLARVEAMEDALSDMLSGWRYIRQVHGDLSGVGWDRAEDKAREALEGE